MIVQKNMGSILQDSFTQFPRNQIISALTYIRKYLTDTYAEIMTARGKLMALAPYQYKWTDQAKSDYRLIYETNIRAAGAVNSALDALTPAFNRYLGTVSMGVIPAIPVATAAVIVAVLAILGVSQMVWTSVIKYRMQIEKDQQRIDALAQGIDIQPIVAPSISASLSAYMPYILIGGAGIWAYQIYSKKGRK